MHLPVRSVLAHYRETHPETLSLKTYPTSLETQLLKKFGIRKTLLGSLEDLLQHRLVPQLKMIGSRRKCHIAIERREFTQLRRNQNASLLVDQNLMRTADVEQLKRSHLVVEAGLLSNLLLESGPFIGRIHFQATLALEDGICDIQAIMTIALEFFAEADRDIHPSFVVDRVIESSVEHRLSP